MNKKIISLGAGTLFFAAAHAAFAQSSGKNPPVPESLRPYLPPIVNTLTSRYELDITGGRYSPDEMLNSEENMQAPAEVKGEKAILVCTRNFSSFMLGATRSAPFFWAFRRKDGDAPVYLITDNDQNTIPQQDLHDLGSIVQDGVAITRIQLFSGAAGVLAGTCVVGLDGRIPRNGCVTRNPALSSEIAAVMANELATMCAQAADRMAAKSNLVVSGTKEDKKTANAKRNLLNYAGDFVAGALEALERAAKKNRRPANSSTAAIIPPAPAAQ